MNDFWKFDFYSNTWEYITGNKTINTIANYVNPYPGGITYHAMVIDNTDRYLYVFGGEGFDGGYSYGI